MLPQIHLLFGFLGAGKTTLVTNLLKTADSSIPTAVIVNEFGDVGIDGEIIRGNSIDTVELVSGCICCTLRGSLMNAIEELANEKGAERIVIEATGVADPEEMLDDLEDSSVTESFEIAPIVAVVDSSAFSKIRPMLGEFYVSQILNADVVIVNKIDKTDEAELKNVTKQITEINPSAEIRFTEFCDVESSLIFSDETSALLESYTPSSHEHHHEHHHHEHHHEHHHDPHDTVESFVISPYDDISMSDLERFFERIPDKVWRMKGHMKVNGQPALVQYSAGQLDISDAEPKAHYRMVAIGQELDKANVASTLGRPIAKGEQ